MLTGPSGAVTVRQGYLLSGTTYRIPFDAQRADGSYQINIGAGVEDAAGIALGTGGAQSDTFTLALPDLVVSSVTPSTGSARFGDPMGVSWSVKNAGASAATGPWIDNVYLSTTTSVGSGAIYLGSFNAENPGTLAPGGKLHRQGQCDHSGGYVADGGGV